MILPPLPAGAADCHMHVLGPFERFPLAAERAYTDAEAPLEAHERMKRVGARGRAIAVVSQNTPPAELRNMHAAGVEQGHA